MTERKLATVRGFTLIELLVVVGVIAVLMAILLPSLALAREHGKAVRCGTNMRQWVTGAAIYASAFDGILPGKGDDGSTVKPVGFWSDQSLWFNAIPSQLNSISQGYGDLQAISKPVSANGGDLPSCQTNSIYICPSTWDVQGVTVNPLGGPADETWSSKGKTYFKQYGMTASVPMPPGQWRPALLCYVWNSKMVFDPTSTNDNAANIKVVQIPNASSQILMIEKRVRQDELRPTDPLNPLANSGYNNYSRVLARFKSNWDRFTTRHFDGGSVGFLDGHVERIKYKDLNTPSVVPGGLNLNGDWNQPGRWIWNPFGPAY